MSTQTPEAFAGIDRLYGVGSVATLQRASVLVVGIGGVGSWVAEGLARSGIGRLALADLDDLCVSNTNRQIHALTGQYGRPKVTVMAERIHAIAPATEVLPLHTFVTDKTVDSVLAHGFDLVIDCGDHQMAKAALIAAARQRRCAVITVGAAGGRIDPTRIQTCDLAKTDGDALLAAVRQTLRNRFGFPRSAGRRFLVTAVFSDEQTRYQQRDGSIGQSRPSRGAQRLDCAGAMGAATHVTGSFAWQAVGHALKVLLAKPPKSDLPSN